MATLLAPRMLEAIEGAEMRHAPFSYFLAEDVLSRPTEAALLDWFDNDAPWTLAVTDFYQQYEFDMRDASLPPDLADLATPEALDELRLTLGAKFGRRLGPDVQCVAHRLVRGQRIGIHNDVREDGETHRLTVQVNRGLGDEDGGFFVLFNSADASNIHRVLRPISNSAIGFAIGPNSHHAVSALHGGVRYSLVYSFRADTGC